MLCTCTRVTSFCRLDHHELGMPNESKQKKAGKRRRKQKLQKWAMKLSKWKRACVSSSANKSNLRPNDWNVVTEFFWGVLCSFAAFSPCLLFSVSLSVFFVKHQAPQRNRINNKISLNLFNHLEFEWLFYLFIYLFGKELPIDRAHKIWTKDSVWFKMRWCDDAVKCHRTNLHSSAHWI